MRLNQFLARAGAGSRRACDELIRAGRVQVNRSVCTNLGTRVEDGDDVRLHGRAVRAAPPVLIAMNKPRGVLCTSRDERDRRTVHDFLPPDIGRLFTVGRLDMDSEGLILLTNDGPLSERLTRPAHHVEKEYLVTLDRALEGADVERLLKGMRIPDGSPRDGAAPRRRLAYALSARAEPGRKARVVLEQGINRQIRVMFEMLGYRVSRLRRTRIGGLGLGRLRAGEWRYLRDRERERLLSGRGRGGRSRGGSSPGGAEDQQA